MIRIFQETAGVQVYENPASCNSFYKCENGTATAEVGCRGHWTLLLLSLAIAEVFDCPTKPIDRENHRHHCHCHHHDHHVLHHCHHCHYCHCQECENGLLFDPMLAQTDAVHNYCVYM